MICDTKQQLLPIGIPGELLIAGPSVARGYVGRPDLTKEKFLPCTLHPTFKRMYRTGDLCRWNNEGKIEFLGRIDTQIKLRGFRIEVSEIEHHLATFPGVTTAVVVLRNDAAAPYLAAYLICEPTLQENFSEAAFRNHLKNVLPPYMIPSRFAPIRTIPRSPTGKLDRGALPKPDPPKQTTEEASGPKVAPSTPTEYMLHDIWTKFLPGQTISIHDNFFEIGGHSLLAGKVASEVRRAGFDGFSIRYLYGNPTIHKLAEALDKLRRSKPPEPACTTLPDRPEPSTLRKIALATAQLLVLQLLGALAAGLLVLILYVYDIWTPYLERLNSVTMTYVVFIAAVSGGFYVFGFIWMYLVLPLLKLVLIGRFKEGTHSIWSFYYFRFWTLRLMTSIVPFAPLQGTVFLNWYLRMMGAKIGRGVIYCAPSAGEYDLLDIGEDAWIGNESLLAATEIIDGLIIHRKITIGRGASVGARCCVRGGCVLGENSILTHLSMLHEGTVVPPNEIWGGSPAVKTNVVHESSINFGSSSEGAPLLGGSRAVRASFAKETVIALAYMAYSFLMTLVAGLPTVAILVSVWAGIDYAKAHNAHLLWLLIPIGPTFIGVWMFLMHLMLIALRWVVLPHEVKPGNYPYTGLMFHRKMFFDMLMRISLTFAHPMYASLFTQYFLRGLGVKIGPRVECSNLYGFTPGLIKLGRESFVADFVGVNPPEIYQGVMKLAAAEVEDRAFLGNGAVLPAHGHLSSRSLLGLLSVPVSTVEEGATYIGSPAFSIPRPTSNVEGKGQEAATYRPTAWLVFRRVIWEFGRSIAPATALFYSFFAAVLLMQLIYTNLLNFVNAAKLIILFGWINVGFALMTTLIVKWIVVGVHEAGEHPLWSSGVWRAEFVTDVITVLGGGSFLQAARGTLFLPIFMRLLGAKIGKNCYLDTIFLTEPDLITIGDNCCIGDRVTIQTHLFEDRVMKMDSLQIGDRCTIGSLAIVLYNTKMERGVTVGPLSLVMKGESYPAGTHWEGIPAQRRSTPQAMAVAPRSAPTISVAPPSVKRPSSLQHSPMSLKKAPAADLSSLRDWLLDDGSQLA
jgi:non-ribosomal peptide synthetase-like protein